MCTTVCTSRTRVLGSVGCGRVRRAHGAEVDSKHDPDGGSNYAYVSCPRLGTTSVDKAWSGDVDRSRFPRVHGDPGRADRASAARGMRWSTRALGGRRRYKGPYVGVYGSTAVAPSRAGQRDHGLSTIIHKCPQGGFGISRFSTTCAKSFPQVGTGVVGCGPLVDSPNGRASSTGFLSGTD